MNKDVYSVFIKTLTELESLKSREHIFPRTIRAREKNIRNFCKENGIEYEQERERYISAKQEPRKVR